MISLAEINKSSWDLYLWILIYQTNLIDLLVNLSG